MSLTSEEYHEVKEALHVNMREALNGGMIVGFNREDRDAFISKVNTSYDDGLLDGLRLFICEQRARQFILWLAHQVLNVNSDCGYCTFLDGIYSYLDAFLEHPYEFYDKEVKTI